MGRVALQLITGEPPARQGDVPSHPLRPLVERLLVVDPGQRIATAEAALRLLRRLPVPPPAGPPVPDRLGPPPRRRRTTTAPDAVVDALCWVAVAGLVGVVVGCLWVLLGWAS